MMTDETKPKDRILLAAKKLFNDTGYVATSVRKIASDAAVDPTLVIRHYGSKELLFLEAMMIEGDSVESGVGHESNRIGENIVRFIYNDQGDIKNVYTELLRASHSDAVTQRIKIVLYNHFESPIIHLLDGDDKETRASMISAMMMGLMNSLWVLQDEQLLNLSVDQAVAIYGNAIQSVVNQRH